MTFQPLHLSVSIDRPAAAVYAFVSDPRNLPRWASGLSGSIEQVGGEWIAESPLGRVKIEFAPRNEFGVLDHDVTLASGERFFNPMRVFANAGGCEVVFTLYRRPDVTDAAFAADADLIRADLETLKRLLA